MTSGLASPRRALLQAFALAPLLSARPAAASGQPVSWRDLAKGLYEIAFSPKRNMLFVASIGEYHAPDGGGIFCLDPVTLETRGFIATPSKSFALGLNDSTGILYAGNTHNRTLTAIDIARQEVIGVLRLDSPENLRPREIRIDDATNTIFVGGVEVPSMVWVVDGERFAVVRAIRDTGKSATGLAFDAASRSLYIGNNEGQVVVADAGGGVTRRHEVSGGRKRFLVNVDFDPVTRRVYAAEANEKDVLVIDAESGALLGRVETGRHPLAVLVDAPRRRVWVTNRGEGTVSLIDATRNVVSATFELGNNPNSLALDPASGAVFTTIKKPITAKQPGYDAAALDTVARITA